MWGQPPSAVRTGEARQAFVGSFVEERHFSAAKEARIDAGFSPGCRWEAAHVTASQLFLEEMIRVILSKAKDPCNFSPPAYCIGSSVRSE